MPPSEDGCLIIDVRMPGIGGLDVQERLQADSISLPVIVITGHGDVPLAVRAMKAGAVDFVEKPFAEEVILAAIERALKIGRQQHETGAETAEAEARFSRLTVPSSRRMVGGFGPSATPAAGQASRLHRRLT